MPQEEIEFVFGADGKTTIKVLSSKRNCHDVTKPFEEGGEVKELEKINNPGLTTDSKLKIK